MSVFDYSAFEEDSAMIKNKDSFKLLILSHLVNKLILAHTELNSSHASREFAVDYYKMAVKYINACSYRGLNPRSKEISKEVATSIKTNIELAKKRVLDYGSKLITITDFEEICYFIKELVSLTVDDVRLVNSGIVEDGDDSTIDCEVEFITGDVSWQFYSTLNSKDANIETKITINGSSYDDYTPPTQMIIRLFKSVVGVIMEDLIRQHKISLGLKQLTIVKQAKQVEGVINGDFKEYIPFILNLHKKLYSMNSQSFASEKQLSRVLMEMIRADKDTINKITKALVDNSTNN